MGSKLPYKNHKLMVDVDEFTDIPCSLNFEFHLGLRNSSHIGEFAIDLLVVFKTETKVV